MIHGLLTLEPLSADQFALGYEGGAEQIYQSALTNYAGVKAADFRLKLPNMKSVAAAPGFPQEYRLMPALVAISLTQPGIPRDCLLITSDSTIIILTRGIV